MAGKVNYQILGAGQGVTYIGDRNDNAITNASSHYNTYFNIDMQQSAYFTMLIEGFDYSRFYVSYKSITNSRDYGAVQSPTDIASGSNTSSFDNWGVNASMNFMPLKSLNYSQGSIETMSIACGAFSDLALPFRKKCPTLAVEMYDHRSDFFEMKLREWHTMSVVTDGFVPILESITKKVTIKSWATNGECNSTQTCDCLLADDISVTRDYSSNDLKTISFKLIVVGY